MCPPLCVPYSPKEETSHSLLQCYCAVHGFLVVVFVFFFSSIPIERLEKMDGKSLSDLELEHGKTLPSIVYFNKGL